MPFVILLFSVIIQSSAEPNENDKKRSWQRETNLTNQLTIIIDYHHTCMHYEVHSLASYSILTLAK